MVSDEKINNEYDVSPTDTCLYSGSKNREKRNKNRT